MEEGRYLVLRCQRVAFNIFLCLCLRIFFLRFLITEPKKCPCAKFRRRAYGGTFYGKGAFRLEKRRVITGTGEAHE